MESPGIQLLNSISMNSVAELDTQEFSCWTWYPGIQLLNLISRNSAAELDIHKFSCWNWYPGIQLLNLISRNSAAELDIQEFSCWTWYPGIQLLKLISRRQTLRWVGFNFFITNSNFLVTYHVELRLSNLTVFYRLKNLSSATLSCKDKGIRKSEFFFVNTQRNWQNISKWNLALNISLLFTTLAHKPVIENWLIGNRRF